MLYQLSRTEATIDHVVQDEIGVGVREAELALVGLSLPELGRRRLSHDRLGDSEVESELAKLRLVEIADRVDAAGHVAELRAVTEQELRLVARSQNDPIRPGSVVLDALPLARHLVADAHPVHVFLAGPEVGIHLVRDRDLLEPEAEPPRKLLRVGARLLRRDSVRREQPEYVLGTERFGCECCGDGAVDTSGDPDDRTPQARLCDLLADEEDKHLAYEHFVDPERRRILRVGPDHPRSRERVSHGGRMADRDGRQCFAARCPRARRAAAGCARAPGPRAPDRSRR